MSKARRDKKMVSMLYDTASVPLGFDYWFYKLLNYVLGIFKYDGLPDSLPGREILMNLIITGHAVIFENKGELVTTRTTLYDFDEYYRPTKATFGNVKLLSRTLRLGKDSEVIYLTRIEGNVLTDQCVDSGLLTFIKRYARMLADIESTIDVTMVNTRLVSFPVASNDSVKENLSAFFNKLEMGERAIITDDLIIEAFRNVDIIGQRNGERLNDLLIARDKILSMFLRDIGVKFEQEQKRAQLTEDEVTADEQLLLLNVSDMLEVQKEGVERVNKMYNTDITVSINPLFDRTTFSKKEEKEKEEIKDDNTDNNGVDDTNEPSEDTNEAV